MYALCRFAPRTSCSTYPAAMPLRTFASLPTQAARISAIVANVPGKSDSSSARLFNQELLKSKYWCPTPLEYDPRHLKSDCGIMTALFLISLTGAIAIREQSEAEKKEERMAQEDLELQALEKQQQAQEALQKKKVEIVKRLVKGDLRTLRKWLNEGQINLREHEGLWLSLMNEYCNEYTGSKVESIFFLNAKIPESVNEQDSDGKTPLFNAVQASLSRHVSVLLEEINAVYDVASADWMADMLIKAKEVLKKRVKETTDRSNYILEKKDKYVTQSDICDRQMAEKKEMEARKIIDIIEKYCSSELLNN